MTKINFITWYYSLILIMLQRKSESLEEVLKKLQQDVSTVSNADEVTTDKHDIWSVKKLLVLRYYVEPFLRILRKYNYKNIHYVDPFAGSGFLKIQEKLMPGTPLVPLLRTNEIYTKKNNLFFNSYHLSDEKLKYVKALKKRIPKFVSNTPTKIEINRLLFKSVAYTLFKGVPPIPKNRYNDAFLVVLDPYGFDVEWTLLERILKSGAVDVILTFHTNLANWTKNKENSKEKLVKMFGSDDCLDFDSEEEFLTKYCTKIQTIPVSWPLKTRTITVPAGNQTYHLICISRSNGALKVFSDMQKKFDKISEEQFESLIKSALGNNTLQRWFD